MGNTTDRRSDAIGESKPRENVWRRPAGAFQKKHVEARMPAISVLIRSSPEAYGLKVEA